VLKLVSKFRMRLFTLILIALWAVNIVLIAPHDHHAWLGISLDLLVLFLAIPAFYYSWIFFKYARNRILWKIRRRLILAHIFIGTIPFLILAAIFLVYAFLLYYQFNYFLINNQIGIHKNQINAFTLSLRDSLQQRIIGAAHPTAALLKQELDADAQYLSAEYRSAAIRLSFQDPDTKQTVTYSNQSPYKVKSKPIPGWLNEELRSANGYFSGLVTDDTQEDNNRTKLYIRSYVSGDFQIDFPFSLEVSVPLDRYFLDKLRAALGQDMLLTRRAEGSRWTWILPNSDIPPENILESTFEIESARSGKVAVWPVDLFPFLWSTGSEIDHAHSDVLQVEVSFSNLIRNLFHSKIRVEESLYFALKLAVGIFLLVEIISILIGIRLTKSITTAVHNLDRGTEFVKRGDFSHRIIVRSQDQLGALAASFNQMTEYVQHLVKEQVQKERLEREIEIAKEVQERLFPNQTPLMSHMEVTGICLPARMVSGDYYDFLPLGNQELGLAVGDICGKGISAALLMANLQAALRSNVMNLWIQDRRHGEKAVAEVVARLNRQIYSYTSANKFASFFYALYDDAHQTLTYCNAGHNPPLCFSGNEVRRLNVGGTVVGIFADSRYDQETVQLNAGDLFIAYTDGIVECVNEYGEEFGEGRLIQVVQENRSLSAARIKELVVERVLSWSYAEEREDDMTLIVARIHTPDTQPT
jgi:serine phosphatase RsbU (regulator of sigma subunit)